MQPLRTREQVLIHASSLVCDVQIELSPGVNLSLAYNTATMSGGGIHVTTPPIRHTANFFNRLCFLQYLSPSGTDTPPSQWQVELSKLGEYNRVNYIYIVCPPYVVVLWLVTYFHILKLWVLN